MKISYREKMMNSLLKTAKKYPLFKGPILLYLAVILFFYYLVCYIGNNAKRFATVGFAIVFFVLSSSFSFPVVAEKGGFVSGNAEDQVTLPGPDAMESAERSGAVLSSSPERVGEVVVEDDELLDEEADYAKENGIEEADQYSIDDILTENNAYLLHDQEDTSNKERSETIFDASDWRLILINKQHPIPEDYTFDLVTIKGNMQCDSRVLDDLLAMMQAAKKDGINLVIRSPYRDMSRQEYLFDRKITKYMGGGMSYMEAYKTASQAVTVPGASEHQIGLAIDITTDDYVTLDAGFGDTAGGEWLAENSWRFGFILRYPLGKEYITSIEFEPWHFRYVGVEAAAVMKEGELTLEEFVEKYL